MNKILALAFAGVFLCACQPDVETAKPSPPIVQKVEKPKTAVLVNGLGVYTDPGMMGAVKAEFERRGWKVEIINHVQSGRLTQMPRVVVTHSKGGNTLLKHARKFKKNPPDLIVTIDPGRAPQFSQHPGTSARVVNIRCWYHLIGGQEIYGANVDHPNVCGTDHLVMPHDKRVLDIIFEEVEKLK